tara:strand:+ start:245 stop:370 length:126 start_codon:yes stop_codon:yes gene_type:complete
MHPICPVAIEQFDSTLFQTLISLEILEVREQAVALNYFDEK